MREVEVPIGYTYNNTFVPMHYFYYWLKVELKIVLDTVEVKEEWFAFQFIPGPDEVGSVVTADSGWDSA